MKKNAFILSCFLSLFTLSIQAQLSKPLIFTHYSKKDGLASNNIMQVLQDKTGFIWLATDNGLQRYDGNKFVVFLHSAGDSSSIPDNVVHKCLIDKKDRLWLACGKKIGLFDKATFRFKAAGLGEIKNAFSLRKIMEDDAGRLILFFGGGKMLVYNESKNEFEPATHLAPLPEGYTCEDLVVDPLTKRYWITGKTGLMLYDPATKQYSYRGHNILNDPTIEHFGNIANTRHFSVDQKGRRWMVSWIPFRGVPELYSYDPTTGKFSGYKQAIASFAKSYFEIWGMQQQTGSLWLYGMNLFGRYNESAGGFSFIPSEAFRETGIHYDHILSLYEDREHNTWVGTNMGLYRVNPAVQHFINVSNHRPGDTTVYSNAVSALWQTKDMGLWVSTWGDGIFSYDNNLQPIPNPVTDASPTNKTLHSSAMLQHSNGEIWIGLQAGDMKIYDPVARKVFSFNWSAFEGNNIRQMAEDQQKNIWIITDGGLLVKCAQGNWRDSSKTVQVVQRTGVNNLRVYVDRKNNIWVCTDWKGMYKIDAQSGKVLTSFAEQIKNGDGLMQEGVSDILQYNDSIYLIAANGVNILNANTGHFSFLTQAEGLPADGVVSFVRDAQDNIWISMANGFCRLNMEKKSFVSYDVKDGITTSNFEVASSAILPNGLIAMGTLHDLLLFDPKKVAAYQPPPAVVITNFTLGNKPLLLDSLLLLPQVTLPYNKNAVNIEFSTLSFFAEYKISYMLEGFDTEWKTAGKIPEAIYTYLPPGSYTFKVKAENADGIASKTISTLKIKVNPAFWNTWWFYGILLLIAAAILYWLDRVRIEKREATHAIRSQIADDLHQQINTTLNNITLLSEMAKMKADKDVDRSKEYINQIHEKSRRMKIAMDDILWSIDPANDSMQKSLLRLTEFTQALKSQHRVDIEVTVDEKVRSLQLEMKRRYEFIILYTEALMAVVEYAHSKATLVNIEQVKNKLSLKISANSAVADRDQDDINSCMQEVQKRAAAINASVDVQVNDQSLFITVLVPVD